jgi:UDP-3-O-[3-hydroxymyristoyl] glucosamine N-acyltransferase
MLAKIQDAKPGQIAFLANPKYEQYLYTTKASAVIINRSLELKKPVDAALIRVEDPYSSFTGLLEAYDKILSFSKSGVEEPSYIGKDSVTGAGIYRGAFSYIGQNVKIGEDHTIIHAGVKIYPGNIIGSRCEIHAGTVIGSDGFGFAPQADGSYKKIPQLGKVKIEDDVTIGAGTVIDCATMAGDFTIIRQGVKLDNLIQIAHNVEVGSHTVIAAQAGISGSTVIGAHCMIGGQVGIAGHLNIAERTGVAGQSGVTKSIRKPGTKVMGPVAFEIGEFFKAYAVFKRLPELFRAGKPE